MKDALWCCATRAVYITLSNGRIGTVIWNSCADTPTRISGEGSSHDSRSSRRSVMFRGFEEVRDGEAPRGRTMHKPPRFGENPPCLAQSGEAFEHKKRLEMIIVRNLYVDAMELRCQEPSSYVYVRCHDKTWLNQRLSKDVKQTHVSGGGNFLNLQKRDAEAESRFAL